MTPKTSQKGGRENHALEKSAAAADRSWMSRKISSPGRSCEVFFLDIPFYRTRRADTMDLDGAGLKNTTMGVGDFLGHYSQLYSDRTDLTGTDVAISMWRLEVTQTRYNIRAGNFWDYLDTKLNETAVHYINNVEAFQWRYC
jgi:hypothetical protein